MMTWSEHFIMDAGLLSACAWILSAVASMDALSTKVEADAAAAVRKSVIFNAIGACLAGFAATSGALSVAAKILPWLGWINT